MCRPLYLTTTIPYVNAPPHIGFALELAQADAIARYHRLVGREVRFQTGTDENAFKNVLSARARGVSVQTLVTDNSVRFRQLGAALGISIDHFVRTTDDAHRRAVHALLARLRPEDVFKNDYHGLYCTLCEDFYVAEDLAEGRCPEHLTPVTEIAERNVFFRLSAYQSQLRELIASRRIRITPENREREVLQFIDRGLVDISISRDAARSEGWGISFPGEPDQVVYVWIDALINYLSELDFPDGDAVNRFWARGETLHLIGKNVWKFHAIYWPALLLSAGLPVPEQIVVHGFLTSEGRKISKSSGDATDPSEYLGRFGVDGVRYFLLRRVNPFDDADFTEGRVAAAYSADLSNGIGNLTSRLTALCETTGVAGVVSDATTAPPPEYAEHLARFRFDLALTLLWEEVTQLNRDLVAAQPWVDIKHGRTTAARAALEPLVARLARVGYWLTPFLPSTGAAICTALSATPIRKCDPLFPRLGDGG